MSQRNAVLHTVGEYYRRIEEDPEKAPQYMRALLFDLLPPQQKQIYAFCSRAAEPVTTPDIEQVFSLTQTHASSLLKELWEIGLLAREQVVNQETRYFAYTVRR
jgi:predicted transcriptional regulator